ncbi:MAG: threonine--tRNA ligase [Pseudomonadota bacterium]|nr:threonine--tRNA ligase [Pseudomonadota bacterium]
MLDIIIDNKNISIKENQSIEDIIGSNFDIDNVVAAKINNRLVDLSNIINENCTIQLIKNSDEEGLEIIRHTCAHVFGHAIKQLYPDVKMAIGPVIENGFYYDIYSENSISEKELEKIESLMKKLVTKKYIVKREVVDRKKAIEVFTNRKEDFKLKLIDEIPNDEIIAIYHHEEYIDMCRGPHLTNTRHLRAFKLTKVSGSYWKGDSKNQALQRIYGTAWNDKEALDNYLHQLEEAEKRDHRKLGKKLNLFHFQEESPGMVFWHNQGWIIFNLIKQYITDFLSENNYQIINTPQILDKTLWKKSGHLDKFSDLIFDVSSENREYAIKPMSCPGHVQIYNQGLKSYKDLPIKLAEFGLVHRNEPSGTLHGLMRIRAFTQDDAHIFCTTNQIEVEIKKQIENIYQIYKDFGFSNVKVELSTRPELRVGDESIWDKSEESLKQALDSKKIKWALNEGDGAFYGPKIDFSLKDSLGRVWQLGTIQLDFSMPARLDAYFINEKGEKENPVMIHRAILGSLERFVGILLEEYSGDLPLWLAPTQMVIMNITKQQEEACEELLKLLKNHSFRPAIDLRNEKISYKIREHTLKRIPYLVIIGDREASKNEVSVRTRTGEDLGSIKIEDFITNLEKLVSDKSKLLK